MMVRFYSYVFFLSFSASFYVGSYTLADSENNLLNDGVWETKEFQRRQNELDSNRKHRGDLSDFVSENQIAKADEFPGGNNGKRRWSSVLTFERLKNLTEKDKGPCNDTKIILINTEDHLTIYENDDDDDENETGVQDRDEQRFGLLSPEGFLSRIHSSEEKGLERTKRQAEGGRRRCRCRRKGRRRMRRRRRRRRGRRRRVGQTRPARRRRRGRRRGAGRRRGRRRCVCRNRGGNGGDGDGEGEGKGEEDPEVEEEETTTTEGGGSDNEEEEEGDEGEEGGEGDEGEEGGEEDEGDGEDEDSDDEEDTSNDESEEKGPEEESLKDTSDKKELPTGVTNHERPIYVMYPGGAAGTYGTMPNAAGAPVYTTYPVPFSPYPYYTGSHSNLEGKHDRLSKM